MANATVKSYSFGFRENKAINLMANIHVLLSPFRITATLVYLTNTRLHNPTNTSRNYIIIIIIVRINSCHRYVIY